MCGLNPDTGGLEKPWSDEYLPLLKSKFPHLPNFLIDLAKACTTGGFTALTAEVVWLAQLATMTLESDEDIVFLPLSVVSKDQTQKLFTTNTWSLHQVLTSSSLLRQGSRNGDLVAQVFLKYGVTIKWLHSCGSVTSLKLKDNEIYGSPFYLSEQALRSQLEFRQEDCRAIVDDKTFASGQISNPQLGALKNIIMLTRACKQLSLV